MVVVVPELVPAGGTSDSEERENHRSAPVWPRHGWRLVTAHKGNRSRTRNLMAVGDGDEGLRRRAC